MRRVVAFGLSSREIVEDVLVGSPPLTRKIWLMFVLVQLSEQEQTLVSSNSNPTKAYEHLTAFITHFLLLDPHPPLLRHLLAYFLTKLPHATTDLAQLTNFEYFHAEVTFLTALLRKALPIERATTPTYEDMDCLTAGVYLRARLFGQEEEVMRSAPLRQQLMEALFEKEEALSCSFYTVVNHLCRQQRLLLESKEYNIPTTAKLHDQMQSLLLLLIRLAHFQSQSSQTSQFLSIDFLRPLVHHLGVPFEIGLTVVRKGLAEELKEDNLLRFKRNVQKVMGKALKTRTEERAQYQLVQIETVSNKCITKLISLDLFSIFWLSDIECLFFSPQLYKAHSKHSHSPAFDQAFYQEYRHNSSQHKELFAD